MLLSGVDAQQRDAIRKELTWAGFAPFSANVLAHPSPDMPAVEERLDRLPGNEQLLVMQAEANSNRHEYLRELVHESWALAELSERYGEFLERFRRSIRRCGAARCSTPNLRFVFRTLLIHEYRKVLLRDPFLPDDLLPDHWDGVAAYQLCRNLYSQVALPTEEFLTIGMETADGPLPPADPSFYQRFGGAELIMSEKMTGLELARACAKKMMEEDHASQYLKMSVEVIEPGVAEVRMTVTPSMVNGWGVCHGGVHIFARRQCICVCLQLLQRRDGCRRRIDRLHSTGASRRRASRRCS